MTYTDNLHLSLPEYADPADVAPIAANFQTLDSAMFSAMGDLTAAADAAKSDIQELVDTAYKPYVTGSYVGDGSASQTIELGFRPVFVYVSVHNSSSITNDNLGYHTGSAIRGSTTPTGLSITANGFTVSNGTKTMNSTSHTYYYIAFK